jgi:choline dehydrogenase-like flavoprotein
MNLLIIEGLEGDNVGHNSIEFGHQLEPQLVKLAGPTPAGQNDRRIFIPRGKVLGGTNELNYMLHILPGSGDLDFWADAVNDDSWNSTSMASFLDEYELRDGEKIGKVKVGVPKFKNFFSKVWVESVGATKYGNMSHCNDGFRSGACHNEHAVNRGVRHSTARAFLLPIVKNRPNLHVLINSQVLKIVLDESNERAVAVDIVVNEKIKNKHHYITVKSTKEIIVSAGAYSTPHLLQLSGIGPKQHLEHVGIETLVDLPGVGSHLQDHPYAMLKVRFGPSQGVWWPFTLTKLTVLGNFANVFNYFYDGSGALGTRFKKKKNLNLNVIFFEHRFNVFNIFLIIVVAT